MLPWTNCRPNMFSAQAAPAPAPVQVSSYCRPWACSFTVATTTAQVPRWFFLFCLTVLPVDCHPLWHVGCSDVSPLLYSHALKLLLSSIVSIHVVMPFGLALERWVASCTVMPLCSIYLSTVPVQWTVRTEYQLCDVFTALNWTTSVHVHDCNVCLDCTGQLLVLVHWNSQVYSSLVASWFVLSCTVQCTCNTGKDRPMSDFSSPTA